MDFDLSEVARGVVDRVQKEGQMSSTSAAATGLTAVTIAQLPWKSFLSQDAEEPGK